MMNYILFDDFSWNNLLPLTFTRPVAQLRIGILTIREKWEKHLNTSCSYLTQDYLAEKYKKHVQPVNILINGAVLPNIVLVNEILNLKPNEAIYFGNRLLAACVKEDQISSFDSLGAEIDNKINTGSNPLIIDYPWDIFKENGRALTDDFELITLGRKSAPISKTNNIYDESNIFIEEGAVVEFATLNTNEGPIYIGIDAEVMEGSVIRGPFALGEHSQLKIMSKIYGPTTIGPYCRVGGEVNNSVIFGYSNKGHDGFLGNSVIGEWCNIGADSNNSNLKNNYAEVRLWNYVQEKFISTGLQFCGLIMGDHSKSGINTMFNTGTVVGVNANIFGAGFPRNFIPSFSWGGTHGFTVYSMPTAFDVAKRVMERRSHVFDEVEKKIMTTVFNLTEKYRKY